MPPESSDGVGIETRELDLEHREFPQGENCKCSRIGISPIAFVLLRESHGSEQSNCLTGQACLINEFCLTLH